MLLSLLAPKEQGLDSPAPPTPPPALCNLALMLQTTLIYNYTFSYHEGSENHSGGNMR